MRESIDRVVEHKKIEFIPGCAELGDCDPTSTAIGIFPCGEKDLVDPVLLQKTFDRIGDKAAAGMERALNGALVS